jgi:2-polyprenyl-3-methyl-5-hydroxy-6-metoxy-1,4-benzoquinol methylase
MMSKIKKVINCPICLNNSKIIYKFFSYEKSINKKILLKITKCNSLNCGHIFLGEYSKKDLNLHYSYPRLETKINKSDIDYYQKRIKFIKQNYNYKNLKTILEIGPGDGFFLREIDKLKKYFYDINPYVISKLNKKFTFINITKTKKKFDLICASHVLEHVINPYLFLKNITQKLSNNGVIFLEVPDYTYFSEPEKVEGFIYEHLNYFSLKSINNLFEKLNLEIIAMKRFIHKENKTCHNYAVNYLLNFKNKRKNKVDKILQDKNKKEINLFKNYLNKKKKVLVWGVGTNFFRFSSSINLNLYKNLSITDIREGGKKIFMLNIFKPSNFANKKFDVIVLGTSDVNNVKISLKNYNIRSKNFINIKS